MIKVLGAKRVLMIVALLAVNGLFAAAIYGYLQPEKIKQERVLNSTRSQASTVQLDIDRLQLEFDQLEEQRAEFDRLKNKGFFSEQGRRQAELILQDIQQKSGVTSAIASISKGEFEDHEEAQKADHHILKSPITLRVTALDDLDVFRYIYMLETFFPGHITVESMNLRREADVSGVVLRSISSGNNPELVTANIKLLWRTMIPKDTDATGVGAL